MPKFINAVKAAEEISRHCNIDISELVDIFADIHSADVVEVVRCKNCIYSIPGFVRDGEPSLICDLLNIEDMQPDDFCSYGKRSDENA